MIELRDFDFLIRSHSWTGLWIVGADKVVSGFCFRADSDTEETAATCRYREQRTCQVSERRLLALRWITGADAYCRRNIDRTKTVPPKERMQNCIGKCKVIKRFSINGSLLPAAQHLGHNMTRRGLAQTWGAASAALHHDYDTAC